MTAILAASGANPDSAPPVDPLRGPTRISQLPIASVVYTDDLMFCDQGTPPITRRVTVAAVLAMVGVSVNNTEYTGQPITDRWLDTLPAASTVSPDDYFVINTVYRGVVTTMRSKFPGGSPTTLYICAPGPQYPSNGGLRTGNVAAYSANVTTDNISLVQYEEPSPLASKQRYYIGWQDQPYSPARSVTITLTEGTDFSRLRIGFALPVSSPPFPGPYTTNHETNGVEFYIKGTGGIYTYDTGTATETLIQATAALQVNDAIGLDMEGWQYGVASIKLNGAAEVTQSNIGYAYFVEGSAGLAPSVVQPALCCTEWLLDNFNGTGLLSAHTPDTAPSGFAWRLNSGGTMTLDGAGLVKPTGATVSQYIADSFYGWTGMSVGQTFSMRLSATMPG